MSEVVWVVGSQVVYVGKESGQSEEMVVMMRWIVRVEGWVISTKIDL